MPSVSIPTAISAATAVAGVGQAVTGMMGAGKAGATMAGAAGQAGQLQMQQYQQTQAALSPFINAGASAIPTLQGLLGIAPGTGAIPGLGGSKNEKEILTQIRQGLVDWHTAVPNGGAQGAIDAIDKGAPLSQVQMILNAASATTTHPKNVAWLGQIQQMASQMPAQSVPGALGATGAGGAAQPFSPTQFLEQTPGYQFALQQGLKSTQAGYSSRGLGGAALKGAAEYSTGLAEQTYGAQVQRYMDLMKSGASSAGALGQIGVGQVGQIGQTMTGGASAQAAGQMGVANALGSGIGALGGAAQQYSMMKGMFGGGQSSAVSPGNWSPYGYAY